MQISVENTSDLERRLTVDLPRDELTQKIDERLISLKGQVSVDGYRPGKVPLDVVRSKYGAKVQEEVFSEAISESLQQALVNQQLEPVDKPVVEIEETSDPVLRYSATFEIIPQVDTPPVDQIKLVRPVVEITESDIDKLIKNLRLQRLIWEPVERQVQSGDRITIDYSGSIDGKEFSGSTARSLPVVIGEGSLIPGFEDQLIGLKNGAVSNIKVIIPETFPDLKSRGKTAKYDVKLLQVEESQLPELDDVFFRTFGVQEGGLATFRKQVKQSMEVELKQKILGAIKTEMLTQLLENHSVSVPTALIQLEIERMKNVSGENHVSLETDDDFVVQARYRISCGIILTELAKKVGVSATPDLIHKKIEFLAESYENPEEAVASYYSSQEQLASVEAMVNEELLIDYVLEHGQVKDQPMSFAMIMDT